MVAMTSANNILPAGYAGNRLDTDFGSGHLETEVEYLGLQIAGYCQPWLISGSPSGHSEMARTN